MINSEKTASVSKERWALLSESANHSLLLPHPIPRQLAVMTCSMANKAQPDTSCHVSGASWEACNSDLLQQLQHKHPRSIWYPSWCPLVLSTGSHQENWHMKSRGDNKKKKPSLSTSLTLYLNAWNCEIWNLKLNTYGWLSFYLFILNTRQPKMCSHQILLAPLHKEDQIKCSQYYNLWNAIINKSLGTVVHQKHNFTTYNSKHFITNIFYL